MEGFSIFVDTQNAMASIPGRAPGTAGPASFRELVFYKELPLYKIVLASPSDFDEEYVDVAWQTLKQPPRRRVQLLSQVVIQWNFKTACEAISVISLIARHLAREKLKARL